MKLREIVALRGVAQISAPSRACRITSLGSTTVMYNLKQSSRGSMILHRFVDIFRLLLLP